MSAKALRRILSTSHADTDEMERLTIPDEICARKYGIGATDHQQRCAGSVTGVVLSGNPVAYSLSESGSAIAVFEFREGALTGANLLCGHNGVYRRNEISGQHRRPKFEPDPSRVI